MTPSEIQKMQSRRLNEFKVKMINYLLLEVEFERKTRWVQ